MTLPLLLLASLVQLGPLHAYSWSPPPADCDQITHMVWFNKDSKPAEIAAESLKRPAGQAALFSWDMHRDILDHPGDVCETADGKPTKLPGVWPEKGVDANRDRFARFFEAFRAAGGKMDLFLLDFEGGYSNWSMGGEEHIDRWRAIAADPRFELLAAKLGFDDIMTVCKWSGGKNYLRWNAVMAGVVDEALQQGVFAPALAAYPKALASNYGSLIVKEAEVSPDLNGHMQWALTQGCGTHQSGEFYGWVGQLGDRVLAGGKPFGRTPYAGLLRAINVLRSSQRSSPRPIMPWVAWQRYAGDGPGAPPATLANTPFYRELLLHLALAGGDPILFWNPHPWAANQKAEEFSMPDDERRLNAILVEINQRIEGKSRKPVTTDAIPWDSPVIATGMEVDDKVVWRVTMSDQVKSVKVQVYGRTFSARPEGNGAGFWLTTSPGAQPILTVE